MLRKNLKGALEDQNKAIASDSTKQIFYTDRGFVKSELGQYKEAISDYDKSLQMEPNHKAYADRGYAYYKLGLQQMAIGDYTRALAIMPDDYEIYYRRGLSYVALGKNAEACEDFTKSRQLGYQPASAALIKNKCR